MKPVILTQYCRVNVSLNFAQTECPVPATVTEERSLAVQGGDSVGWTDGKDVTTEDSGGWMEPAHGDGPDLRDSTAVRAGIVPTSCVQSLTVTQHHNLWWQGSLVGLLGTTVPLVAAGVGGRVDSNNPHYEGQSAIVVAGLTGALLGGLAGSAVYHKDQYVTGTPVRVDTTTSRSRH